ncbi:MAG: hypothetical protein WBP72_19015, partial [Rhodocyclaceae bacterium]
HWLGPDAMRRRWFLIAGLTENWWGTGAFDALAPLGGKGTNASAFAAYWTQRLYAEPPAQVVPALMKAAGLAPAQVIDNPGLARRMVAWAAMAPEYQLR